MQVLHVCSEMFPLLKTGGLADVVGALPAAQIAEGADVRVLLPAFLTYATAFRTPCWWRKSTRSPAGSACVTAPTMAWASISSMPPAV